jgi:hypothetical protein
VATPGAHGPGARRVPVRVCVCVPRARGFVAGRAQQRVHGQRIKRMSLYLLRMAPLPVDSADTSSFPAAICHVSPVAPPLPCR